jgi:hypothetical protein
MDPSQFMLFPDTKYTNTIHEKIQINGLLTNRIGTTIFDSGTNIMSMPVNTLKTLTGTVTINNNDPTANQVLVYNGGGLATWTTLIDNGIISLNSVSNTVQSFSTTTTGTDFTISSDNGTGVHSFNLPDCGATSRGLINTSAQTIAGNKTFTGEVITNNLLSPTNTDLTIDAGGTGKIRINTIQSQGLIFGVNSTLNITDQVVFASDSNLTRPALIMGVINNGTTYTPFIGSQVPLVSWQSLYLNNNSGSVVYCPDVTLSPSSYNVATYKNVFVGACNIHTGGSLSVGGSSFVDSSRNITCANITSSTNSLNGITIPSSGGTLAKTSDIPSDLLVSITGWLGWGFSSSAGSQYIALPLSTTGNKYVDGTIIYNMSSYSGSPINVYVYDPAGNVLVLSQIIGNATNSKMILAPFPRPSLGSGDYLRLYVDASANTGSFYFHSYCFRIER